jgi:hypothetical protein
LTTVEISFVNWTNESGSGDSAYAIDDSNDEAGDADVWIKDSLLIGLLQSAEGFCAGPEPEMEGEPYGWRGKEYWLASYRSIFSMFCSFEWFCDYDMISCTYFVRRYDRGSWPKVTRKDSIP